MSAFPSAPLAHVFLCLYDTAVVFLEACQALVKYGLHVSERWRAAQAERVRPCAARTLVLISANPNPARCMRDVLQRCEVDAAWGCASPQTFARIRRVGRLRPHQHSLAGLGFEGR